MIKKILRRLINRYSDFIIPDFAEVETVSANQIQQAVRLLISDQPIITENIPESEREWALNRAALRGLLQFGDLRYFLRWDVVRRTMYVTRSTYAAAESRYLLSRNIRSEDLREDSIGSPHPSRSLANSSDNLIHHQYHLEKFKEVTGISTLDFSAVLEFGGGYGSLCRLLHRAGFSGKYHIFDLPEFSLLQEYYLRSLGLAVLNATGSADDNNQAKIHLINNHAQLQKILDEGFLFIGTWSISETSLHFRSEFWRQLPHAGAYLIAYQNRFNEVDNQNYFQRFREERPDYAWHSFPIKHLPGHHYLFGVSKARTI